MDQEIVAAFALFGLLCFAIGWLIRNAEVASLRAGNEFDDSEHGRSEL